MVDGLTDFVSSSPFTYLVVVGAVALDAVLPLIPGEAVVLSAAVVAVEGELSLWLIVGAAAVGGFIGDNITYFLGRKLSAPASRRLFRGDRGRARLEAARRLIRERGSALIIGARFIPGGRTATTFAAGMLAMEWRKFAMADALALVAWAGYTAALATFGGETFKEQMWAALLLAFGVAFIVVGAFEGVRRVRKRRAAVA